MRKLILLLILLLPFIAYPAEKTLKVGVALGEPFAMYLNNEFEGIAVDIWKQIAEEEKLQFEFVSMGEHIDDAIQSLSSGQIDVLIGPIIPIYERTKLVDFMQPFYLNQIGLVVRATPINFFNALGMVFTTTMNSALLIFILAFFIYLNVFWFFEIKPKQTEKKTYFYGIAKTFWMHTLDIDLGKIPSHSCTKQCRFLWLILLTLFFSSITASITSALTIALTDQYASYSSINDFKNKKIAAVIHTAPYDIAKSMGLHLQVVNNRDEAIQLVLNKQVAAYADYYPIADYYLTEHQLTEKLKMANLILKRDYFAFAIPINNPLRHSLDLRLRALQDNGVTKAICDKYFKNNERGMLNCEI